MILEKISLTNFKNYENISLDFCRSLNCFTGLNGSGKTNLLDAIHYLSLTKSAFNSSDSQNIRHENNFFSIRADFDVGEREMNIQCSLKVGEKKSFKVDGSTYEKLSEHIGRFPVVLIAPNDDDLIRDSSEVRRKFFDSIISQTDKVYLQRLIEYNRFLKQRNSLLKKINETGRKNIDLLDQYGLKLIGLGKEIAQARSEFVQRVTPEFNCQYEFISGGREQTRIVYSTKVLAEDFKSEFARNKEKDIILQRTTMGIHRDDYLFEINGKPIKKFGSQGQQKSFLISLKLAQFEYVKSIKNLTPILLLDDIFDKLDDVRIEKLVQMIAEERFGQIFLTDARAERTSVFLSKLDTTLKIFKIEENAIFEVEAELKN